MGRSGVLLVEDDDRTREHLARAIEAHERLTLLGAGASCREARRLFEENEPDVLLTDLGLPDGSGIELIREIRQRHPGAQVMVITVSGDEKTVIASVEAGAHGYVLKQGTTEEIGEAVCQLVDGGSPISAPIARYLLRRFRPEPEPQASADAPSLTGRETEVLKLIAKGFTYGEIAGVLEISSHTVTTHVRHIYAKLEVGSKSAAVYEAVNLGLIRMDD